MLFLALLGLVTMGLLAAEAFSSRRLNRSLWRDGFLVTVTRERLGIGRTPSEIEGRPAIPWRAEVWVHGEDGQLPRSLPFVKAGLKLPPPERVHLLDGSLYLHAGPADYRELDRVVRVMVSYAKELAAAARRLRGQAFEAAMVPDADVERRIQALDVLLTHFPASLEAEMAAKDAVVDPHPAVRLRGALALGDAGQTVIRSIATDPELPETLRVRAFQRLAEVSTRAAIVPVLIAALLSDRPSLRAEARRWSGRLRVRDAVPVLLRQLRMAATAERRQLLSIVGRIGDPRAESAAIAHLTDPDPDVCREAIRCLGRVGRPSTAVPQLQAWLRTDPRDGALRELAEAVIQALGRPEEYGRAFGRLSLVNDDSLGAVSVPEATGALAVRSD